MARIIEVFSAGCATCHETIEVVKKLEAFLRSWSTGSWHNAVRVVDPMNTSCMKLCDNEQPPADRSQFYDPVMGASTCSAGSTLAVRCTDAFNELEMRQLRSALSRACLARSVFSPCGRVRRAWRSNCVNCVARSMRSSVPVASHSSEIHDSFEALPPPPNPRTTPPPTPPPP